MRWTKRKEAASVWWDGLAQGRLLVWWWTRNFQYNGCVLWGLGMRPLKKDSIYLIGMLAWRQNWWTVVTAWSACIRFVATVVITDADWLGLHAEKSATIYNCLRWKGRYILWTRERVELHTVSGDQGWYVVGGSGSELKSLERGGSQSGEDLKEVRTSELRALEW